MTNTIIYNMDVLQGLGKLQSDSIDCIVTSPPYYGLRNYGIEGQIGLETSYKDYLNKMLQVTSELKRVLKPSGTFWLNIGDTYFAHNGTRGNQTNAGADSLRNNCDNDTVAPKFKSTDDLSAKSRMQIPERLSLRMTDEQDWILRNDIVWSKPNPMPESVTDRLSRGWEHIYLFVKEKKYYFNLDAIREQGKNPEDDIRRINQDRAKKQVVWKNLEGGNKFEDKQYTKAQSIGIVSDTHPTGVFAKSTGKLRQVGFNELGKNPGDVWRITTKPFKEAHFAVFPPELPERCIKAGCPQEICLECGKPKEAIVDVKYLKNRPSAGNDLRSDNKDRLQGGRGDGGWKGNNLTRVSKILGYKPTCSCNSTFKSGIILDPFAGSGTTLKVAKELRMDSIGIEINSEYCEIIKKRLNAKELLIPQDFKIIKPEILIGL